jgi:hypothetical protein
LAFRKGHGRVGKAFPKGDSEHLAIVTSWNHRGESLGGSKKKETLLVKGRRREGETKGLTPTLTTPLLVRIATKGRM